ncbi:MAG TPA: 16S rRNA (guanine(527)-N(7))-methyltransferase RsmG [Ramlibacter sp.]|jgi:16S rRNA (guanine527-N7)-methyltransferase|uniref:16S rRNA (guanine(527)-N(7))-methyltransferase RsmG n=1 Tax=Ramlibacter sp. TaxID=1917967 RepID=UPI002D2D10A8|nr:16S rRNA (guanine(527)-N(7))-methyltransferase RsmG [Ramlibacter sp.]HZY17400.1 16S rRNA (guanine(527)-N(7))-methyltransferase RsmG [Ramlibacter sp.]
MSAPLQLRAGATDLQVDLNDTQIEQLMAYLGLLQKWGKVYNLTAVREEGEILTHHLLDSLAAVAPLRRQTAGRAVRLLDVGAGAGLPGVVIAICCPEIRVECLDAVAKKAAFVQQAAVTLGLKNLRGVHARVETVTESYEVVSSRAFASLADFVAGSDRALAAGGVWLAMKGKHPADEIASLPADVQVFHVEQLHVPGLAAQRCIVWMRRDRDSG